MTSNEILTTYIKKLSHPLQEIRERSLQLLGAKLRFGWELEDELAGTRNLLEALLSWFSAPQPSMQNEALNLLLNIVKTDAGTYIAKEFGVKKIVSSLLKNKPKIDLDKLDLFNDLLETLQFLNSVVSEENVNVPPLVLHSLANSESDNASNGGYYNIGNNIQTSNETSSNEEFEFSKQIDTSIPDGIRVLLFPWVELCSSDSKTILLVEDALKLHKSTRRCCRFIRNVFLRDFPAEIFLNRPTIVQNLLIISDGNQNSRPGEALDVLYCITQALRSRLLQLTSVELICEADKVIEDFKEADERMNQELEQIAGCDDARSPENGLAALRQLPAPMFALDTLHVVITIMARSITLVDSGDCSEALDLKELNICLRLAESLVNLLLDCVNDKFWLTEHHTKTHRDIAHKSCMDMRLLGDVLMKYRKSFTEDSNRSHHRVAWLRLVLCAEKLLTWAKNSAMPPTSLVGALQTAQLDPGLQLFYPELSSRIALALLNARTSVDQEYKSKYKELTKLFASMDQAAQFMKRKHSNNHNTKTVLNHIQNSLPALELHLSEEYLNEISDILLYKCKDMAFSDSDWANARCIALSLMAHNVDWISAKFYNALAEMVKSVLVGDDTDEAQNEKCLLLLCDVGILTEICCHGLASNFEEVQSNSSEIMLYLLRGRLVLSDACWWRLLASLLPVLPLLHVYAAHDTDIGQAICKSLETDIAECMGISLAEVVLGLTRLLFVQCPTVQLDAAHSLCCILDDERYLPPKESLRTDVLINALKRVEPQDFNVDLTSSLSKNPQTTGLIQMLEVLKQDLVLEEHSVRSTRTLKPTLEPTLRRSTLQQLAAMMRQLDLHQVFLQYDGVNVVVAILRMSMMVDDFLAFPECAISCVSVLNSVCFLSRHALAKIPDLPALLIRVILVFPANDSAVLMSVQVLALVAWSGFALQELDSSKHRMPSLPLSVTQRTELPFPVNSYWNTSPNAEHSTVEWLLSDEEWRAAIRVRWWCACETAARVVKGAPPPPAAPGLRPAARDLALLRAACPVYAGGKALLALENATSHKHVRDALCVLESYTHLVPASTASSASMRALPWHHSRRFLSPPASSRDMTLLTTLLHFMLVYMDNVPEDDGTTSWIKSAVIGSDTSIISLLSRDELYPQQTPQENLEVAQLQIHIVKVVTRCIMTLESYDEFDSSRLESLLKTLMACLQRIDLKNFHMLGLLNEIVRSIRYVVNSQYCKLSEDTLTQCLDLICRTLGGSASGGGRKGQACRLDALLILLALLRQIHEENIPVQRWSEAWLGDPVRVVSGCARGARVELRAAALLVLSGLAHYVQLLPHLLQAISEDSLSQYALSVFTDVDEANVVRTAAASLLITITARASPCTDILEAEVLQQFAEYNFLENCVEILVEFHKEHINQSYIEPNVPLSVLERRSDLEVRAQKCLDVNISPSRTATIRSVPTPALVEAMAEVLYNCSGFQKCPMQAWNERGLYRLLFRCTSWSLGSPIEVSRVRAASCRALSAVTSHKFVRAALAATKDCLHSLLMTLTPMEDDEADVDPDSVVARAHSLVLLGNLLVERSASECVWMALKTKMVVPVLVTLLQGLESDVEELQHSALFCLSQLAQSTSHKKHPDKTTDSSRMELLDNLKSPFNADLPSARMAAGDGDCRPEYMIEDLCKVVIQLYQKLSLDSDEDRWSIVCATLSAVLASSKRGRKYGVHRRLPLTALAALRGVRDKLTLQGSVEAVKSAAQNPLLRIIYWDLTVSHCLMIDNRPAKECFADDSLPASLSRLWPWLMLTEQLREALVKFLLVFVNDCPKAWSTMSVCVSGRSATSELCALAITEAARARSNLLVPVVRTLIRLTPHHHCRAIILKTDVLSALYKQRIRTTTTRTNTGIWCARLCEALSRHADGAGALLLLRPLLAAPPIRAALMPALAHVARHRRSAVLQAPDLLELLSGTLLAGDTAEIVSAARAVWALAANNHKAKLLLRSAGVAAAAHAALQRMRRGTQDEETKRALQLLIYTNTVLQTS